MIQEDLLPEALARKYINEHLEKTSWKLLKRGNEVPSLGSYALPELEVNGKNADYALYMDGKLWAIVEAKKEGCESVEHALVQEYEGPLVILKKIKDAEAIIQDEIKKIEKVLG